MDTGSDSPHRSADDRGSRHRPTPDDAGGGTFADVFNSFTFDGGWRARRRKKAADEPGTAQPPADPPAEPSRSGFGALPPEQHQPSDDDPAAIVRSYVWTRGRTRGECTLELETLVSASVYGQRQAAQLPEEHYSVVRLCSQPLSIAEIAALLSLPLGVARVLVGDVAEHGLVHIHESSTLGGEAEPGLDLIGRLLTGLRRL